MLCLAARSAADFLARCSLFTFPLNATGYDPARIIPKQFLDLLGSR